MPTVATQTEIVVWPYRASATFTTSRGLPLTVMDVIRHAENRQHPPRYLRNEERVDILTALGRDAMQNTLSSLVDIGERLIASQGLVLAALEEEPIRKVTYEPGTRLPRDWPGRRLPGATQVRGLWVGRANQNLQEHRDGLLL